MRQKFSLGPLYVTPGAAAVLDPQSVLDAIRRHAAGDWGDLCEHDRRLNDTCLRYGGRLLSAYADARGTKFWLITEEDRSATTVLLPEEY